MSKNENLHKATKEKNDEFYTQLSDIEKELKHYKEHFKDKVVFCNCDDPKMSKFYRFFALNFKEYGLKKLITTHFDKENPTYKLVIDRDNYLDTMSDDKKPDQIPLEQNGDFRSPECIELLKEADIVVTNPPFSLFREYIAQLVEYDKKFIVVGNNNSITYKEIFKHIKDNKLWLGTVANKTMEFQLSDSYTKWNRIDEDGKKFGNVPAISWFTNLNHSKRNEELILYKSYKGNEDKYPKYDNYDAIEVSKTSDIPMDYDGLMGVPITFLDKYNPEQFEIKTIGIGEENFTPTKKYEKFRDPITKKFISDKRDYLLYVKDDNGKYLTSENYRVNKVYARILIKNKKIKGE